jgi:hypothetical protein
MGAPIRVSQMRIVESSAPETIRVLSDGNATELTQLVCLSIGPVVKKPVFTSQIRSVLSREPETRTTPSGEIATEQIIARVLVQVFKRAWSDLVVSAGLIVCQTRLFI